MLVVAICKNKYRRSLFLAIELPEKDSCPSNGQEQCHPQGRGTWTTTAGNNSNRITANHRCMRVCLRCMRVRSEQDAVATDLSWNIDFSQ